MLMGDIFVTFSSLPDGTPVTFLFNVQPGRSTSNSKSRLLLTILHRSGQGQKWGKLCARLTHLHRNFAASIGDGWHLKLLTDCDKTDALEAEYVW
jgi:hypothetical protein